MWVSLARNAAYARCSFWIVGRRLLDFGHHLAASHCSLLALGRFCASSGRPLADKVWPSSNGWNFPRANYGDLPVLSLLERQVFAQSPGALNSYNAGQP
jgi:hypothetical protein